MSRMEQVRLFEHYYAHYLSYYSNYFDARKLGYYLILFVLPDKFARFLYEIHVFRFDSLDLPPLLAERNGFDVHGALEDAQVTQNVNIY
jgi:hypothetical protein